MSELDTLKAELVKAERQVANLKAFIANYGKSDKLIDSAKLRYKPEFLEDVLVLVDTEGNERYVATFETPHAAFAGRK